MSDQLPGDRAAIDHDRRCLVITRPLMPALLAIHAGDEVDASAARELVSSGVVTGRHLDPLVTNLLDIMTTPDLVITVEVAGRGWDRLITFWATSSHAAAGTTADRSRFQLVQIEPNLLPFHLAQATGITPYPEIPFTGGCSVPIGAFRSAKALAAEHPYHAYGALRAGGVPPIWADRVGNALVDLRARWSIDSVWLGGRNRKTQPRLDVLDAGPAGLWRLRKRNSSGAVSLQVVGFDQILELLLALLPGSCLR